MRSSWFQLASCTLILLWSAIAAAGAGSTVTRIHYPQIEIELVSVRPIRTGTSSLVGPDGSRASASEIVRVGGPISIVLVASANIAWVERGSMPGDHREASGHELSETIVAELKALAPPGSELAIVTYGTGAQVLVPFTQLASLSLPVFGVAADYGEPATLLAAGVDLGAQLVTKSQRSRRMLIVLGDGTASDDTADRAAIERIRNQLDGYIDVAALSYPIDEDARQTIAALVPPRVVTTVAAAQDAVREVLDSARDTFRLRFLALALPWTGDLVKLDVEWGDETFRMPVPVLLQAHGSSRPSPRPSNWRWILLGLAVAATIGIGVVSRRPRRSVPSRS